MRATFGKLAIVLSLTLTPDVSDVAVAQARPDFSGTWIFNQGLSSPRTAGDTPTMPFPGQIVVTQTPTELAIETTSIRQQPLVAVYKLDGTRVAVQAPAGIAEIGQARLDGATVVITSRRSFDSPVGEIVADFTETWSLSGSVLTIVKTQTQQGMSTSATAVFERFTDRAGTGTAADRSRAAAPAAAAPAGPVPRRPDGRPDLTGTWNGGGGQLHNVMSLEEHPGSFGVTAGKSLIIDPADGIIPYQPWALAERNRRREDVNAYEDRTVHCEFHDTGRLHTWPQEIVHSGSQIIIHAQQHITRVIDMNRREHLPDGIRLWLGDPIGWFEGDTLVVESTNFNDTTRMTLGGDFRGAEAHIVERYAMVDANTINWTMTITNPHVFTRPWTMTSAYPMSRQSAPVADDFDGENTCHEGNVGLIHFRNLYDQARAQR
jgi:hypothetical protein